MTDETPIQVSGGDNLPPHFLKERQFMILTNKTNGSYFWREAGNRLYVEIDNSPVELKYTVAQNDAYEAYLEDQNAKAEKENAEKGQLISDLIRRSTNHALDILEIAFNPKKEKQFTRDQIKEVFSESFDLVRIVANTWFEKKVLNPSLSAALDPQLAPRILGA